MLVKAVKFKRKEDSEWENGISFECNGNMNNRVIDDEGNLIPLNSDSETSVYDVKDLIETFCLSL